MEIDSKYVCDMEILAEETATWIKRGLNGEEGGCKDSKEFSKRIKEIDSEFGTYPMWKTAILLKLNCDDYFVGWSEKESEVLLYALGCKVIVNNLLYFIVKNKKNNKIFYYPDISELEANSTCPSQGEFIGWKLVVKDHYPYYAKLLIPADAERTFTFSNKCRCSKAKVLGIFDEDGHEINGIKCFSHYDLELEYKVGEWVYPDKYDGDPYVECSHGIHFFMTFDEAVEYLK